MSDVRDLMTSTVRHRGQDVRVHAQKHEGKFYFPVDHGIDRGELLHWDGSWWLVLNAFRRPNATVVEARRQTSTGPQ